MLGPESCIIVLGSPSRGERAAVFARNVVGLYKESRKKRFTRPKQGTNTTAVTPVMNLVCKMLLRVVHFSLSLIHTVLHAVHAPAILVRYTNHLPSGCSELCCAHANLLPVQVLVFLRPPPSCVIFFIRSSTCASYACPVGFVLLNARTCFPRPA